MDVDSNRLLDHLDREHQLRIRMRAYERTLHARKRSPPHTNTVANVEEWMQRVLDLVLEQCSDIVYLTIWNGLRPRLIPYQPGDTGRLEYPKPRILGQVQSDKKVPTEQRLRHCLLAIAPTVQLRLQRKKVRHPDGFEHRRRHLLMA